MANVSAFDPEDDVFSNVGGVVGYALKRAADHESVEGLGSKVALSAHDLGKGDVRGAIHTVYRIIHAENRLGHFRVCLDKGLERTAHHVRGKRSHAGNVDGKIGDGHGLHGADSVADAFGGVAYALEVGVDLDDGEDEAEVNGHGLLHGEDVEGRLVDLAFEAVDGEFRTADEVADGEVADAIGLNGPLDGLFGEAGHDQEFFLEVVKTALEADSCHRVVSASLPRIRQWPVLDPALGAHARFVCFDSDNV